MDSVVFLKQAIEEQRMEKIALSMGAITGAMAKRYASGVKRANPVYGAMLQHSANVAGKSAEGVRAIQIAQRSPAHNLMRGTVAAAQQYVPKTGHVGAKQYVKGLKTMGQTVKPIIGEAVRAARTQGGSPVKNFGRSLAGAAQGFHD